MKYSMNNRFTINDRIKLYSLLLKITRDYFNEFACEVRCHAVANGNPRDSFVIDGDKYLLRSYALPMTAYACQLGNSYCIQRAFRNNEEISSFHLTEFDVLECGMCYTSTEESMVVIEKFIRHLCLRISESYDISQEIFDSCKENFQRITHANALTHIVSIQHNDLYHSPGPGYVVDLSHSLNNLNPLFLTDIPYSRTSWASSLKAPGISTRFNLMCPYVGEIAEGSERNLDQKHFQTKLTTLGIYDKLSWYIQSLKQDVGPVTVFAIGLERLAMWLFGYSDIRECNPTFSY